jgi:hypothetical protein
MGTLEQISIAKTIELELELEPELEPGTRTPELERWNTRARTLELGQELGLEIQL